MSLDDVIRSLEPRHTLPSQDGGKAELLAEITATPRRPGGRPAGRDRLRRRFMPRRPRIVLPVAAALAAGAVVASWLAPGALGSHPAAAALDIKRENGYFVITVKDLTAAPERYQAQLRGHGLKITIRTVAVNPRDEGHPFTFDERDVGLTDAQVRLRKDRITTIARPGPCTDPAGCAVGLRVPVGFRGGAEIILGRKARPGERYSTLNQLNRPGEPLACVPFANMRVDRVRAMLTARGVTIGSIAVPLRGAWPSVPGWWFVHEGWLNEPGKALLVADSVPIPRPWKLARECGKSS